MVIAVARTVILYFLIIFCFRMLGKHQVSELEPAEFVLTLVIADIAAVPMQDFGIPLLTGVVPILTLLCLAMILSVLTMKSLKIRTLLSGRPSILIRDGKPVQKEMRRTRMTMDELMEELRLQGYTTFSGIRYAILETNGQMSVLPYAAEMPAAAKYTDHSVPETTLPIVLINDGRLISENLKAQGLDDKWLKKQLKKHGASSVKDVFYFSIDSENETHFIAKELK